MNSEKGCTLAHCLRKVAITLRVMVFLIFNKISYLIK
jgi:hypothetical protein